MGKIEWGKKQFKRWHPSDNLRDLFMVITVAIVVLVLWFYMGYRQRWIYIPFGVIFFFIVYPSFRWLAQKPIVTKITRAKAFTRNCNFLLAVCGLLLVLAGLYLAFYGIKITAEGKPMTTAEWAQTGMNDCLVAIYILLGLLVGGFILLVIQIFIGVRQYQKEERDNKIREIAHDIWEKEGCPRGHSIDHWLKAKETWKKQHSRINRILVCLRGNK